MPQSLSCVFIHLVFSTKNRQRFISAGVEVELHAYLGGVLENYECQPVRIGGVDDHVHLLFLLGRKIALCDLVEELKKSSSKWIKTKSPRLASFAWQAGYGVFSVSKSNVGAARQYIENQRQRHARQTFQDEFRELLKRYEVPFDEMYLWD